MTTVVDEPGRFGGADLTELTRGERRRRRGKRLESARYQRRTMRRYRRNEKARAVEIERLTAERLAERAKGVGFRER